MTNRAELLEAAVEGFAEGVALIDSEDEVVFWNQAAEATLGYTRANMVARPIPDGLETLLGEWTLHADPQGRGILVQARHQLGHMVQTIARTRVLRDEMGNRIGGAVVFHPAESLEALPHGEGHDQEDGGAEFEERLQNEFDDCAGSGLPFGVLWISVDQAQELRKTHGAGACHEMLKKMAHALTVGLRPTDEMGRWGENEFLIITHERAAEVLHAHARVLAGLARTADFRWWGDRVSLTVSIGAAQICAEETLAHLLERAQQAMALSAEAGGNQVTLAAGGHTCSSS